MTSLPILVIRPCLLVGEAANLPAGGAIGLQHILHLARSGTGPARLFGRLTAELLFHVLASTRRAFPQAFDGGATYDRVTLFLLLLRYAPDALDEEGAPPRALSVSGIAGSAGLAFETTRRHVSVLCDHDLAYRGVHGVQLSDALAGDDRLRRLVRELHDVTVAHIADLDLLGISLPGTRADIPYRPAETLCALLDLTLALYERGRAVYGSALRNMVANTIVIANVRHITHDRELAHRYARLDTIPPDFMRLPIRASTLARTLGLPYSTVAREVGRLIREGAVKRLHEGLIVPRERLAHPAITQMNRAAILRALQVMQRHKSAGFRFDSPGCCYLDGRPPRIPLH